MRELSSLLLGFFCLAGVANAQPVIPNGNNFPAPGSFSAPVKIGFYTGAIAGGAGQTWDLSAVTVGNLGTVTSEQVIGSAYDTLFTQATDVLKIEYIGGALATAYHYFKVSSNKIELVADYSGPTEADSKDYRLDLKTMFPLPFNFNDSTSDTYHKAGSTPSSLGIKYYGYGTLIMADRTYNDVILLKHSYGTDNDYIWLSQNPLLPILTRTFGDNRLVYISTPITGVSDLSNAASVSVFPNPSKGNITVNASIKNAQFSLINTIGQTVVERTLNAPSTTMDISSLPKGFYFYTVSSDNGMKQSGSISLQ